MIFKLVFNYMMLKSNVKTKLLDGKDSKILIFSMNMFNVKKKKSIW